MTSLNTCLRSKFQAQAGGANRAVTFNARIMALRFLFGTTCDRESMKRYMQFRTQPRRLPTVLNIEEVSEIIVAAPGPGLRYRAALSISYGAGLRASEVCSLNPSRDIAAQCTAWQWSVISIVIGC